MKPRHGAFISYSHAASREVARGLHKWLQSYAKPWWRWRAVNVFRDETDLAAAPELWSKITAALDDSSHFILLASPEASRSKWCKREIRYWLGEENAGKVEGPDLDRPITEARPERARSLLLALTAGDIAWDENGGPCGKGDFDREKTTALPLVLSGVFAEEPQWVDLRPILAQQNLRQSLSRSNAEFMQAVAQLSAPIRGITDLSRLVSEDYRQHKRTMRTAWAAVAGLALITFAAVWQWREAEFQRQQAEDELAGKQISQSRFLLDQSARVLADNDAATATLLALEALPPTIGAPEARPYLAAAEAALHAAVVGERELKDLTGHQKPVRTAVFSPDGTRIVTASEDATARVFHAATGTPIAVLDGHGRGASEAAFSPDGTRVVVANCDEVHIFDATSGKLLTTLAGHTEEVTSAAFSPSSSYILSASIDDTARIWDAATGAVLFVLSGGEDAVGSHQRIDRVRAAVFSPDGTLIATASEDQAAGAMLWDASNGKRIRQLLGHGSGVTGVSFSPDGKRLATASSDGTARLWDTASGALLATLRGHTHTVTSATFSPDGTLVVTASYDHTARVWNAESGDELFPLNGHSDFLSSAVFSPDGRMILTASYDKTARLWAAGDGAVIAIFAGHTESVYGAGFSPDGSSVVTASADGTARTWQATESGPLEERRFTSGEIYAATFSSDETRVVTVEGNGHARIFDAATGEELLALDPRGGSPVSAAAFSPDGKRVLTASYDFTAVISDAADGKRLVTFTGHNGRVVGAAFSPDGSRVATASHDSTALIWDAADGRERVKIDSDDLLTSLAFSPDGKQIAIGSFDNTARIYAAADGKELTVLNGAEGVVAAVAFSPDGKRLATGTDERTVRIWDITAGTTIAVLTGHDGQPRSIAFSPDGTRLASAATDGTVRLWSAEDGAPLGVLRVGSRAMSVTFSRDGRRLLTGSVGSARIWRAFTTTQALIDYARNVVPRQLTPKQRHEYYLDDRPSGG